jgi:hypothetical protein
MTRFLFLLASILLLGCEAATTSTATTEDLFSDIEPDEHVVFFRTSGWLNEETQEWQLPVHGWIYEPQDSTVRSALLETILAEKFDLVVADDDRGNFSERLNLLIADNERGKQIVIELAGRVHELPVSAENGHFEAILSVPEAEITKFAPGGRLPYSAVTSESEARTFNGEIRLVRPTGLSIVSDIDDTVKISNVTDHKQLLESAFLNDFAAAPGMAALYADWAAQDASFHFVSSSPWQLYTPLQEFLDSDGFPWATFNLKPVRFRDETLFDLFKKGTETKPAIINGVLDRYPARRFILVGDSGEQDPEVYAQLLRERPDQVVAVYIRNVTEAAADDARFGSLFGGIAAERWHLFADPGQLDARDAQ